MPEITVIILAAGEGKRMQSSLPKVLHPLCGVPMIDYVLKACTGLKAKNIFVVASKKRGEVDRYLKNRPKIRIAYQKKPLGTAHSVQSCASALKNFRGYVVILYGDDPLLTPETLKKFVQKIIEEKATLGFITAILPNPSGLGRIVRNPLGDVERVVEEKEAAAEIKQIQEINTGVYCVESQWLFNTLKTLKPHLITKEYYLTDIVEAAIRGEKKVLGYIGEDSDEFWGINNRKELARGEEIVRDRLIDDWFQKGVIFIDSRHVYLDATVSIGSGTVIHPQVFLRGKTKIGKNCVIDCGSVLKDMAVGNHVTIKPYSVLEESVIEDEAQVGPFARIRPGSRVGKKARVGNFVELKKTKLAAGVKANHLTYLGDASIGEGTNVGCGTITCNYDGIKKYQTKIGKKVFIGSDVSLIAPVKVGDGAYI
ncbi:MAG: bifunctional UDP-N-acetylglucosamine diphosphorylase/glucosamine-1-phosphate N-acetyltransferase GlmU, partial [bacterium]|nr:bifunctional UDP-N-acetylglucosamine diphosphorylase/glucosamine-1-phosphate N-acetyltransferase GlmU [bacterium]